MARIDNLTNFLTDVATSIRTKKGTTDKIAPKDFDVEIESIQSGGGTPNLQEKSVTITENTTTEIIADSDYDGLSKVSVTTNVAGGGADEYFNVNNIIPEQKGWQRITKSLPQVTLDTHTGVLLYRFFMNAPFHKIIQPFANADNCVDTSEMFYQCTLLTTLDLSNLDTSNVTKMYGMFQGCASLTTLDLSNFNTSKVTMMYSMFRGCASLTTLDLSNFNTSNVISMENMFRTMSKLTLLDLSNFDTSKVTNMNYMFAECSKLTSLNLSNFNTSNVTNMQYMFANCSQLASLDLSSFNTTKVTGMSYMFQYCTHLTHLDIRNFDFTKVKYYSNMFGSSASAGVPDNCEIIVKDDTAKTWITSKFSRLTNVKAVAEL